MPNGDVYPCVIFKNTQFDYDNVFKKDIVNIWNESKYLNKLRSRKCNYSICKSCNYYSFCNGGCPALLMRENKDIDKFADMRCQIIREEENEKN